jgi:hypothetical protein
MGQHYFLLLESIHTNFVIDQTLTQNYNCDIKFVPVKVKVFLSTD